MVHIEIPQKVHKQAKAVGIEPTAYCIAALKEAIKGRRKMFHDLDKIDRTGKFIPWEQAKKELGIKDEEPPASSVMDK